MIKIDYLQLCWIMWYCLLKFYFLNYIYSFYHHNFAWLTVTHHWSLQLLLLVCMWERNVRKIVSYVRNVNIKEKCSCDVTIWAYFRLSMSPLVTIFGYSLPPKPVTSFLNDPLKEMWRWVCLRGKKIHVQFFIYVEKVSKFIGTIYFRSIAFELAKCTWFIYIFWKLYWFRKCHFKKNSIRAQKCFYLWIRNFEGCASWYSCIPVNPDDANSKSCTVYYKR